MKDWFDGKKMKYVSQCFEPAKKLAADYVFTGKKFFSSTEISDEVRRDFLLAVPDADLTSPLVVV